MITINGEDIKVTLLATMGNNGVIGKNGQTPWGWGLSSKPYRDLTHGKVVLMGRKTFESLPRPFLANRLLIVMSESLLDDLRPDASDASCYVLVANQHHAVILASDLHLVLHDLKLMHEYPHNNHSHLFESVSPLMPHEISSLQQFSDCRELFVVGGGHTFDSFMEHADEVVATQLQQDYTGDVYFPELNEKRWGPVQHLNDTGMSWRRKRTG